MDTPYWRCICPDLLVFLWNKPRFTPSQFGIVVLRHSLNIAFAHGHCMAYTSPPPAAEPPLKGKPLGGCALQQSPTVAHWDMRPFSTTPRHADAIGAGWRSQTIGGNIQGHGWRLRRAGHAEFSLPRGIYADTLAAFQSQPTSFYLTTQPSLILSWASRKNRSLSYFLPLSTRPPFAIFSRFILPQRAVFAQPRAHMLICKEG